MERRLCLIIEDLHFPLDEGIKNAIVSIIRAIHTETASIVIGRNIAHEFGTNIPINRWFFGNKLYKTIEKYSPDALLYFPMSSITLGAFVRAKILSVLSGKPVFVFGLQPRTHSPLAKLAINVIKPRCAFVQSINSHRYFKKQGITVETFRSGVDVKIFSPVDAVRKCELRNIYGIPKNNKVILHVGHLKANRGLDDLLEFHNLGTTAIIVASTTTIQDHELGSRLAKRGIKIVTGYIEHIEHYYQIADVYIFPVIKQDAAIEFPLSVLEAMSCGTPVLSRTFGCLDECFPENNYFKYYRTISEGCKKLHDLIESNQSDVRCREIIINEYTWESVAKDIINKVEDLI